MTDFDYIVRDAVRELARERGYPPTIREVMKRIGSLSYRATHEALIRLRTAGIVTWDEGVSRTLRVVPGGEQLDLDQQQPEAERPDGAAVRDARTEDDAAVG